MRLALTSRCSEYSADLLVAPAVSPFVVHFPCATANMWLGWSPAGTLCSTSALAHVPEISFFVCAEAVATASANTVQSNRIFAIMFFSSLNDEVGPFASGRNLRPMKTKVHH